MLFRKAIEVVISFCLVCQKRITKTQVRKSSNSSKRLDTGRKLMYPELPDRKRGSYTTSQGIVSKLSCSEAVDHELFAVKILKNNLKYRRVFVSPVIFYNFQRP